MESTFQHTKTYRYEILQKQEQVSAVLYVLHGYGHLASYFIRKFSNLPNDLLIVAPEGMHRFYLNGTSGRVGASWMTKEMREMDIADNISWLNALDREISERFSVQEKFLLGFSQGGSTALRWRLHGTLNVKALFIWASDFPPEERSNAEKLSGEHNYLIIGNRDELYDAVSRKDLIDQYVSMGFQPIEFNGDHDISSEVLPSLLTRIKLL